MDNYVDKHRLLTCMGIHAKRGSAAMDAFGLLGIFIGTLVHDGWKSYRDLACVHALCNAHHLRELTYLFEEMHQTWAKQLIDMLVAACHEVAAAAGEVANPRVPPSGKRGRTPQSKAVNLLERLRIYADDVLLFMTDPGVPFTNNLAEQPIRMPKVKQKVSGGFRTFAGAQSFCTIRSYLDTMPRFN